MSDDLMSLDELCQMAKLTPSGFRSLRQQGRVPSGVKLGRRLFFKREVAEKWMRDVRMVPVDPPRRTG